MRRSCPKADSYRTESLLHFDAATFPLISSLLGTCGLNGSANPATVASSRVERRPNAIVHTVQYKLGVSCKPRPRCLQSLFPCLDGEGLIFMISLLVFVY